MKDKIKEYFMNIITKLNDFDTKWFFKINNSELRCSTLNSFMLAMTQLGEAWLPLMAVMLFYTKEGGSLEFVQKIIWSFAISGGITQVIKHCVDRTRPTVLPGAITVGPAPTSQSFPSGHTTSAFAFATTCALFFPNWTIVALILASLAGISRIYLGVHYPLDVLFGGAIGILTSVIVYIF